MHKTVQHNKHTLVLVQPKSSKHHHRYNIRLIVRSKKGIHARHTNKRGLNNKHAIQKIDYIPFPSQAILKLKSINQKYNIITIYSKSLLYGTRAFLKTLA